MSELNKTTRIAIETEDEDSGEADKSAKEIEEDKKLEKEKQQKLVIRLLPIHQYTCKPNTLCQLPGRLRPPHLYASFDRAYCLCGRFQSEFIKF